MRCDACVHSSPRRGDDADDVDADARAAIGGAIDACAIDACAIDDDDDAIDDAWGVVRRAWDSDSYRYVDAIDAIDACV
jgi:hypothetical protein